VERRERCTVARIRREPEDFVVEEIPLYPPSGQGEHTFVLIEKRIANTETIARALAEAVGVAPRDIGYAGRKDRDAVTRQYFSVPKLDPIEALRLELPNAKVLSAMRHGHKLRTAQLRGNRFEIRVHEVDAALFEVANGRLMDLLRRGMPNRFGTQRFGRAQDNAQRGRALLLGAKAGRDRRASRFLLSALQAQVFNEVLARRPLPLDQLEVGDVAMIHASGGAFVVDDLEREAGRAATFEISPTGPIFGTKMLQPCGAVGRREAEVFEALEIPSVEHWELPRGINLRGSRRPLRVPLAQTSLDYQKNDVALLKTVLPAGSYVTVLLEELFGSLGEGWTSSMGVEG